MKKYICIGIGGCLGALCRFAIKSMPGLDGWFGIPAGTLLINVSGAFLLVFLLYFTIETVGLDPDVKLGISTGFLGAYTTFSTLCKEIVDLAAGSGYGAAFAYAFLSLVLGFGAAFGGCLTSKAVKSRRWRRIDDQT